MASRAKLTFTQTKPDAIVLDQVLSYNINCPTIQPVWSFDFEVKITDPRINPTKLLLQPFVFEIQLDFGKKLQFIGIIDNISIQSNERTAGVWNISGRDFRSLIIDGNLDPKLNLKAGMKLSDAVDKMLEPLGIKVNQSGYAKLKTLFNGFATNIKTPDISKMVISQTRPQPGSGIYEAINDLLKKHGLLLAPTNVASEVSLINIPNSKVGTNLIEPTYFIFSNGNKDSSDFANNIISSTTSRNYEDVPSYCELYGRSGDSKLSLGKQSSILSLQYFQDVVQELNSVISQLQTAFAIS